MQAGSGAAKFPRCRDATGRSPIWGSQLAMNSTASAPVIYQTRFAEIE
jgi:hypothetical protein